MELNKALEEMKSLAEPTTVPEAYDYDAEAAHIKADDILREVLVALGQDELVKAFSRVGKWYA
jgi:hypothetical protein